MKDTCSTWHSAVVRQLQLLGVDTAFPPTRGNPTVPPALGVRFPFAVVFVFRNDGGEAINTHSLPAGSSSVYREAVPAGLVLGFKKSCPREAVYPWGGRGRVLAKLARKSS